MLLTGWRCRVTMAKRVTVFSWGYYGWGTHGKDLLRLTAAVEAARGFTPPPFVDIRARRTVRARDFNGEALRDLAGPCYTWIKDLGNQAILGRGKKKGSSGPQLPTSYWILPWNATGAGSVSSSSAPVDGLRAVTVRSSATCCCGLLDAGGSPLR